MPPNDLMYPEALAWLLNRTDLERQHMSRATREQMSLVRPAALLEGLGNPQREYLTILVAGSKGKGSTAVMLASILQQAGLLTGLYSQPHLHTYRERVRVDGVLISRGEFAAEVDRLRSEAQALARERPDLGECTTFELTTALAVDYFARAEVDAAVIEVGLGGRLDATNVVEADLSLLTPISYEHMEVLGSTLTEISFEKAGIIKPGKPVLSASQRSETLGVLARVASERRAPLAIAGGDWTWRGSNDNFEVEAGEGCAGLWQEPWKYSGLSIALLGAHQLENAAMAAAAAQVLAARNGVKVPPSAIAQGLAAARWPGRIEIARERPTIIVDGAHNGDSAEKLAAVLRDQITFQRLWLILGVLEDKDLAAILAPLASLAERIWTVKTRHPRSRTGEELSAALTALGISSTVAPTMADAIRQAVDVASPEDAICITGSLSTAAEAREALGMVQESERDWVN